MSDILTEITLPCSNFSGLMDYGRKTPEEMIAFVRKYVREQKEQADKMAEMINDAPDSAFQINVVRGPYVRHLIKELQHSDRKP